MCLCVFVCDFRLWVNVRPTFVFRSYLFCVRAIDYPIGTGHAIQPMRNCMHFVGCRCCNFNDPQSKLSNRVVCSFEWI